MRALTVDCVTNRRSAAFTKLPAATTDKKVRASSVSIAESVKRARIIEGRAANTQRDLAATNGAAELSGS
jgi:hypothetical protein